MSKTIDRIDTGAGALSDKVLAWEETKSKLKMKVKKSVYATVTAFVDKLDSLIQLPHNWDSHGANTISIGAAVNAIRLFCEVMYDATPLPQVVPTNRGNIQLEWHQCGIDLEIEISESGEVSAFFEDLTSHAGPEEWSQGFNYGAHKVRSYLQALTDRSWKESISAA
jgi:hypothetical protein